MTRPEDSITSVPLERPATIFEQLAMDVALLKSEQSIDRGKFASASEASSTRSELPAESLASRSPCASAHRELATPHSDNVSSREADSFSRALERLDQQLRDEVERVSNLHHERNSSLRTLLTDALEALSSKFQHRLDVLESSICTLEAELRDECDRVISTSELRAERMRSEHGDAIVVLESRLREMVDRPQRRLCTIPEMGDFEGFDDDASLTPRSLDTKVRGELERVSRSILGLEALLQQHNDQYLIGVNTFSAWAPASPRDESSSPNISWAPGTPREAGSLNGVDGAFVEWAPCTPREEKSTDCSVDLSSPRRKDLEVIPENVEAKLRSEIDLASQALHVLQDLVGVHHAHFEGELKKLGATLMAHRNDHQIHAAEEPSACGASEEVDLGEGVTSRRMVASRSEVKLEDELVLVSQACEGRHSQLQKDLATLEAKLRDEIEAKLDQSRAAQIDPVRHFLMTSSFASTPVAGTRYARSFGEQTPLEQASGQRTPSERISLEPQEDSDSAPGSTGRGNSRIENLRGKIAKLRRGSNSSDDLHSSNDSDMRPAVEFEARSKAVDTAVEKLPCTFTEFGRAFEEGLDKMGAHCSPEIKLR